MLLGIFLVALLPRLYSAQTVGWHWYGQGSFTPINFDEANTCRMWLKAAREYSPLVGAQTVSINTILGHPPPANAEGNYNVAKAYCLSGPHMLVARSFSAFLGAATVVLTCLIAFTLSPHTPRVAWTAGLLLALSGFHATQSHMATVDVAMTFYIYLFILSAMLAVSNRKALPMMLCLLLMLPAIFAKKVWPFPLLALLAFLPASTWRSFLGNMSNKHFAGVVGAALIMAAFAFNTGFQSLGWYPLLGLFYLAVPWRKIPLCTAPLYLAIPWVAWGIAQTDIAFLKSFTTGYLNGKFGSGFGAIGWNKLDRNLLNLPVLLIVGLGLPAALLIPRGVVQMIRDQRNVRLWLCLLPILAWTAYMLLIAPKTTYRHYLPLIPATALLAAQGYWSLKWAHNKLLLAAFFLWPALLLIDFELDFHQDTRRQAVHWYQQHAGAKVFHTFYASPPPFHRPSPVLFKEEYAMGDASVLRQGDYLVLSENWYETAQAQELNGFRVTNLERLVKTTPERAALYRQILAGRHPDLTLVQDYTVSNFMPELVLHKVYYGTFQKFVGDLKIYRISK
ncbi:hypothetical protein E2F43_18100 [Seongchinamella unica]|uniref:Glycosyltransferase RgtA/B/C/D-like domain-containing protein n=1 Tax=Seongchinamella unica TaxID=2547392 RepID=A0A4R5LNF2_9GAMM|nr:hypothetical protein [Seongchinamella unica]TDG11625.1 hypothetical protein E2F43_18100 [Seongchinamella unica]